MTEHNLTEGFEERITGCSDEEVIEILKKRNYYNPDAANLAIGEAIKRGLIFSKDDLLSEEYRMEPFRFSFFPAVKNDRKEKLIKSLSRGLLLVGIIPMINGYLKFAEKKYSEVLLMFCFTGLWIFFSAKLMKKKQIGFMYAIIVLAVLSIVYVARIFGQMEEFRLMDMFVAVVFYGIVFYSLFYIKVLISIKKP